MKLIPKLLILVRVLVSGARAPWVPAAGEGCHGLVEDGVHWDVVRVDLAHMVQMVLEGALSRDLLGAKDSQGRDPAVSYGDVQLQRHLERFQQLASNLPADEDTECKIGRRCVQLFVSALYSGLQWEVWFERYRPELVGVVHGSNWTEAFVSGWPLIELFSLIAELHGGTAVPEECGEVNASSIVNLIDVEQNVKHADIAGAGACPFLHAVAEIGFVSSTVAATKLSADSDMRQVIQTTKRLLSGAQLAVRRALGSSLGIPDTPLFAPPMPNLLSRLARDLQRKRRDVLATVHLDIVYCGHVEVDEEELQEICGRRRCELHLHSTENLEESLATCYVFYRKVIEGIRERREEGLRSGSLGGHDSTLLLSPLLWQWADDSAKTLRRLVLEQSKWREQVSWAGLPCLNRSRLWNWPVQRLRHQYWKLDYSVYATGHETSPYVPLAQHWAVGDTTSGSRLYSTSTLLDLMELVRNSEEDNPQLLPLASEMLAPPAGAAELFVAFDVAAKIRGLRAHTMLVGTSREDDYRARVVLSSRLARTFHVEAARFLPGAAQQQQCLFPTSKDAAAFTSDNGVVVSFCTRMRLRRMFQDIGRWWLGLKPRKNIIVPVSASVLNLFRTGDLDLFPWDADIDANFISQDPVVVGQVLEDNREQLLEMGYDWILKGDRAVIKDIYDTARMDIWFSGPQDVVQYDIRARLCGVRVNFFPDQLEGTVFYYRPAEKIYGNTKGRLLHCRQDGHNACLPDCVRKGLGIGSDGCEFKDRFVHLDE